MDAYSKLVRRLRAEQRTLRLFVEHTPAAVAMFDRKMRYLAVSRRWLDDYRIADREIIGRSHYEIFPEIPQHWKDIHRRCLAGAVESHDEDRFERADGSIDWVRWRVLPWHDEDDEIGGIIMFTEVVTGRKRLEERLRQSEKMEALGRLAGGIAHDFNNLTMIIGASAELVNDELPPEHALRPLVAEIQRAAAQAASLTRRLLAFSRRQPAESQVVDLNRIVIEALAVLERSLGPGITIETDLAPDLGRIKSDPAQLIQVLLNLAANARDAMAQGGVLTIATRNVSAAAVPSGAFEQPTTEGYVALSMADTGCGMDPQTRAHAFEPFFTTKEMGRGTGLGLAVVHGIVHQHDGAIVVDAAPGRGSTLTIFLPRTSEPLADCADAPMESPARVAPLRVLLVEDDPAVRKLTRGLLCSLGHEVVEAGDGPEALRVARQAPIERIELLVTDVVMPYMSGFDLCEALGREGSRANVIFMSGQANGVVAELGQGQRMLTKPFTRAALQRAIGEVMVAGS